jgi:AraC-like DNA-binding protein/mannose-6-phosphate isomerase-like protein (cupin superfamily)
MEDRYLFFAENENLKIYHALSENIIAQRFQPHYHDRYEILFLQRGNATYTVEGRSYKLKRADIVISRPRRIHRILPDDGAVYERFIAIINQNNLPEGILSLLKEGRDVFSARNNDRILDIYARLDEYYERFDKDNFLHLASNLIEELILNLSLTDGGDSASDINPIIERALDYINDNLTTISGIEELCNTLYITKSHLHHLFTRHLQATPAKYILAKRLILAQRMIKRGHRPTEIFLECGFSDYTTFFRNYKRHFGYAPNLEGKARKTHEIYI